LYDLGKHVETEAALRRALTILEKLAADSPDVPLYSQSLANNQCNLGIVLAGLGKRVEAESAFRDALRIQERLADQFADNLGYRTALARTQYKFAMFLAENRTSIEVESAYRDALPILEKLVADFPNDAVGAVDLGGNYCNFANVLRDSGKVAESLDWYARAVLVLEQVLEKDNRLVRARQFLRNTHACRAVALEDLNRFADAVNDLDRAVELDDKPGRALFRCHRASCLARAGEHAKAYAEANDLADGKDLSATTLYNLACVCSIAATAAKEDAKLAEQYQARSLELLRQAVAMGYNDVQKIKVDKDLDALRSRDDFKNLMAELELKSKQL
jgi:tetratricopeptide (TPR) repeat protein